MNRTVVCVCVGIVLCALIALFPIESASASPAAPVEQVLEQPDGTTFAARQWGDEWANGYDTLEGYAVLQLPSGWWVYAQLSEAGGWFRHGYKRAVHSRKSLRAAGNTEAPAPFVHPNLSTN
jgi:hypothetical protein